MTPIRIPLGATNVYVIRAGSGAVCIDAGPDYEGAWEELTARLAAHALTPADCRAVALTHAHRDHAGLAARWQHAGTPVYAGRGEEVLLALDEQERSALRAAALRTLAEHGAPVSLVHATLTERTGGEHAGGWPGPLRMTPVVPDRLLSDGDQVRCRDVRLDVLACPGHTPGSVALRNADLPELYTGDHLLPRTVATVGIQFAGSARQATMPMFTRSLGRLRTQAGVAAWPGHGALIADVAAGAAWSLRYIERRAGRLRRRLSRVPATAFELVMQLFPHLGPQHLTTVMAETIGLLDLLEERGEAAGERRTGVVVYRAAASAGRPAAEELPP